jgi:hypothetical protein
MKKKYVPGRKGIGEAWLFGLVCPKKAPKRLEKLG